VKLTSHPSTPGTGRSIRLIALVVGCLFALSACGFEVQTLRSYTPGDGVNIDVGLGPNGQPTEDTVKVRGLLIVAQPDGTAFLSAGLACDGSDELTEITGVALNPDGSAAGELTIEMPGPIEVADGELVELVEQEPITVSGELTPGLTAGLTLTFAQAGSKQVQVPIVDGAEPPYASVTPSPAPTEG
jgi:hypothetical protein